MSWKRKMGALSLNRVPCNLVFGWPPWGGATAYLIHSICFVCLSLQELAFVGRVCDTLSLLSAPGPMHLPTTLNHW